MPNVSRATTDPSERSCSTCPSFIRSGAQQHNLLGKVINAPLCGMKMIPLISPKQDKPTQDRVFRHRAKNCDHFGVEIKESPLGDGDIANMSVGFDIEASSDAATVKYSNANCGTCKHFVNGVHVNDEYGWTTPLCKAQGTLLLDDRLHIHAQSCGQYSRRIGPASSRPLATFQLFPEFRGAFGKVDPVANYRSRIANIGDPLDYETDREVRPGHAKRGIIAWRKITDPDGYGEDVFLPVYGRHLFTEEEHALIPITGSDEHPELYADHAGLTYSMTVLWMKLDETPAWWGQGGTGKTEFARYLAWLMATPFHRINITGSTEIDDIAGKMLFEEGETRFKYGRLPQYWQRPGIILLDEPNTGPPDVWQLIRPLTDNSRMLVLDQNKGERIRRHTDCYFTLAMNPAWDVRNVGANTIGDADSSRMMHMLFDFPPHDLEVEIIQRRVGLDGWQVPAAKMDAVMNVSRELRELGMNGTLHTTWGLRHQIKLARALRYFPPSVAYRRAVGDALEPSQMTMVRQIVESHFGE